MARLIFTGLPAGPPIYGGFGDWYTDSQGRRYQHRGVDHGPDGAEIRSRSTRPALAVPFTNDGSFGNGVCLKHDHEGVALYELNAHMRAKPLVKTGDWVQPGQLIGYVGATGAVTGPHDHWQLCRSPAFPVDISQSLDPMAFIGEEEDVDARIRALIRIAAGDFQRMDDSYQALVRAGLIANDLLPYNGVQLDDLNNALVRRFRILEIAMADNYADAYAAIGG